MRTGRTSYSVLWADDHNADSFGFDACGGGTTASLLSGQLGNLDSSTTLVSISIGGNDYPPFQLQCQYPLFTQAACAAAIATETAEMEAGLPDKLDEVYQTVQELAPNARIVALNYQRIYNDDVTSCTDMPQGNRIAINGLFEAMRDVIADRAAANGVDVADPDPYYEGHRVCDSDPWMLTLPVLRGHPNAAGNEFGYLPAFEDVVG